MLYEGEEFGASEEGVVQHIPHAMYALFARAAVVGQPDRPPVEAQSFRKRVGRLAVHEDLNQNSIPPESVCPPGYVAMVVNDEFLKQYAPGTDFIDHEGALTFALKYALRVPLEDFSLIAPYRVNERAMYIVVVEEERFRQAAAHGLERLAKSGVLLGIDDEETYRQRLSFSNGLVAQTVDRMLAGAAMTDEKLDALAATAVAANNYEFAGRVKLFRERAKGAGQGQAPEGRSP
jgi:hypothetical protein